MNTFSFEDAVKPANETFSFEEASAAPAKPKTLNYGDIDKNVGVAQGAAQVLSGAAAAVPAGLSGIGAALVKALGITDTDPAEVVRKVQEALTYQAPSETGQSVAGVISYLPEKLAEGANVVGEKTAEVTGSPALGAAVNAGIQFAAPTLLGKVAKVGGAKLAAMEDTDAAKRAVVEVNEKPHVENVKVAREAGYKLSPNYVKGGVVSTNAEGLAGSAKLERKLSAENQPLTNNLIRKDIGLDDGVTAEPKAIQAIIDDAHKPYEAVKKIGPFENDAQFASDIDQITQSRDTAAESYPHRQKLTADEQRFQDTVDGLKEATNPTTKAAVEEVKLLRADAAKAFKNGDSKLGAQYRALAEAVDSSMDRALQKVAQGGGDPALTTAVAEYRAARVKIAKAYQALDALGTDGNFDAHVYGRMLKNDVPLTGPALQVATFGKNFPRLAQQSPRHYGADFGDLVVAGARALGGKGDALLSLGARPALRSALASDTVQKSITKPPTYGRPISSRAAQLAADAQAMPEVQVGEMGAGQGRDDRLRYLRSLTGEP